MLEGKLEIHELRAQIHVLKKEKKKVLTLKEVEEEAQLAKDKVR
jgi:hypothetical protein